MKLNIEKILVGFFIAVFVTPYLAGLLIPNEDWPVTSAPMFAHYVDDLTPRYRFRFMGHFNASSKKKREIRAKKDLGIREWNLMRFFFGKVYGSIDPYSPFGHHPEDNPERFQERLGRFFQGLMKQFQKMNPKEGNQLERIDLLVVKLDSQNRKIESRRVGFFNVSSGRFVHSWQKP